MINHGATRRQYFTQVAVGHSLWAGISWAYDNPLYIAAVVIYGPLVGGGMMTAGSLLICWGMLLWYNKQGTDWLGVGAVDSLRELSLCYTKKLAAWRADSLGGKALYGMFNLPIRLLLLIAKLANHPKHGEVAAFVLLSIFFDPFITTAYLRHGRYGPMRWRERAIFFGSVLFSNAYWIARTSIIIELALAVFRLI